MMAMSPYATGTILQEAFEKVRRQVDVTIDPTMLRKVKVHESRDFMRDEILVSMMVDVAGRKERVTKIRCPRTWWQHFKKTFFPAWVLETFPVTYDTYEVVTWRVCPHLDVKESQSHYKFLSSAEEG